MIRQIIFLCLFFFSLVSQSFTLNSSTNPNLKGWSNSEVKIFLNPTNCPSNIDVVGIIKDAVEIWNNIPNSTINVSYGGATTSTAMIDPPTAYCETNFQAVLGADQDFVPGAASVDGSTGSITRGILYLNASAGQANIGNFDRTILKIILAHEIGHLLGLGHSSNSSALMYYDASYKQQFRLSQDDLDGMAYLYPQSNLDLNSLAGCGLVRAPRTPNDKEKILLLALLMLPLALLAFYRYKLPYI